METSPGKEALTILRRLIAYSEKVFRLSGEVIAGIADRRPQPRILTARIVQSVAALFWTRMGSLNALELVAQSRFFKGWLGHPVCSADTIGRVLALVDAGGLRKGIHHVYDCLKRKGKNERNGPNGGGWVYTGCGPLTTYWIDATVPSRLPR
jgi:hypothetical protein